jgi:hypothetical protein
MNDLSGVITAVLQELERAGERHSCITAAGVLLDVLHVCGISDAYPLTVRARVLNPTFAERLQREPFPTCPETLQEWTAAGGALVLIGKNGQADIGPDYWDGHLVIVIPGALSGRPATCDLTLVQANRPELGIDLMPVTFTATERFLAGEQERHLRVNGSLVVYKAFPGDCTYETAPAWTGNHRATIARRVLTRLGGQR